MVRPYLRMTVAVPGLAFLAPSCLWCPLCACFSRISGLRFQDKDAGHVSSTTSNIALAAPPHRITHHMHRSKPLPSRPHRSQGPTCSRYLTSYCNAFVVICNRHSISIQHENCAGPCKHTDSTSRRGTLPLLCTYLFHFVRAIEEAMKQVCVSASFFASFVRTRAAAAAITMCIALERGALCHVQTPAVS